MPTILIKKSDTPGAAPTGSDLTNLAGGAEIAVNTADKRVFSMNSSSAIIELGTNPGSLTTADASATVFRSGSATITNLIATTGTITDLRAATASATVGRIDSGTITNLTSTSATITTLTATSATIDNFTFTSATVTRLAATSAVISDLSATVGRVGSATITNLIASGGSVTLTTAGVTSGNITTLTSASGSITNLIATTATVTDLRAATASATVSRAGSATLTNLTSTSGTITTLVSSSGTLTNLTSTSGTVTTLVSTSATLTTIAGTSANITTITENASPVVVQTDIGTAPNEVPLNQYLGTMAFQDADAITVGQIAVSGDVDIAGTATISSGTADGVLYLNGSKEVTSGSVVTYDGTTFKVDGAAVFNDSGADVDFRVEGDTDANLLFVDASADAVGIGTNTPSVPFEVKKDGVVAAGNWYNISKIYDSSGNKGFQIGYDNTAQTSILAASTSGTASNMQFYTYSGSAWGARLTIDSPGNLGLGVTPSAWGTASGIRALQVGTYGSLSQSAGVDINLSNNAYYDGTNWKYIASQEASNLLVNRNTFAFRIAASGNADDPITFTQAMTLDASGNLGVGTTTPSGRLDIRASGAVQQYIISTSATSQENAIVSLANNGAVYSSMNFDSADYKFKTSGTERARITSGGDFGIGNSNPLYRLTVDKDTAAALGFFTNSNNSTPNGIRIDFSAASPDNNTQYFLYCEDSTTARVILYSDGDGQNHDNSWGGISDERLKQDIVDANSQWDDIKNLRVRKYRFKSDVENGKEHAQIGLIAQEVMPVSPGLVIGSEDTQYGVQYSILYMKAVKALQEAMTRIEALEAEVAALKGAN